MKRECLAMLGLMLALLAGQVLAQAANAFFKRAFELLQSGDVDVSIAMFRKGLEIEPDNGVAAYYLGMALERKSPPDEAGAAAQYRRASELLKDKPEGLEASVRAARIEERRTRRNLKANPAILNGRWCAKFRNSAITYSFNGGEVGFFMDGRQESPTFRVLSDTKFEVTFKSFLSTVNYVYELDDPDSFRWVGSDSPHFPVDGTILRRCN